MKIETKSQPVEYYWVAKAYRSVKKGGQAVGVDEQSMKDFERKLNDNLYKLWNRMSSGSYMPPPIREHEIPKTDGQKRKLGIPTVSDRIAQRVVKDYMEPKLEKVFHPSSYGYRPGRNAHQALQSCMENCWKYSWVIDLDIKGFFDNIDHELLMRAVRHHFKEKWVLLYVERWLKAPIIQEDGRQQAREKGTPQGGVVSPLLANLFLHYAIDHWLKNCNPEIRFERYADDCVLHCHSKFEAETLLDKLKERLESLKLRLHETKTKIVYCKQSRRQEKFSEISFTFLGHYFRPNKVRTKEGRNFLSFGPEIGKSAAKGIIAELRRMQIHRRTGSTIEQLAQELNPKLQGWISYYRSFGGGKFKYILHLLNIRLLKWVRWRYKLQGRTGKIISKMLGFYQANPKLFAHWKMGIKPMRA